jgi:hypothetical protein
MEINRFEDVLGVVPTSDIAEGRFVLLTSHGFSNDFGSETDLPGCKVPATTEEAKRAKYILTWAVDNRDTPILVPTPAVTFALRGGFGNADNTPFAATVYLTHPGNQEGLTIPSGTPSLGYTEGTFTLPSGSYVYSSNIIVPGAAIIIQDATTDATAGEAGKPKYTATFAAGVIGVTERYDSATGRLTIRVE